FLPQNLCLAQFTYHFVRALLDRRARVVKAEVRAIVELLAFLVKPAEHALVLQVWPHMRVRLSTAAKQQLFHGSVEKYGYSAGLANHAYVFFPRVRAPAQ